MNITQLHLALPIGVVLTLASAKACHAHQADSQSPSWNSYVARVDHWLQLSPLQARSDAGIREYEFILQHAPRHHENLLAAMRRSTSPPARRLVFLHLASQSQSDNLLDFCWLALHDESLPFRRSAAHILTSLIRNQKPERPLEAFQIETIKYYCYHGDIATAGHLAPLLLYVSLDVRKSALQALSNRVAIEFNSGNSERRKAVAVLRVRLNELICTP